MQTISLFSAELTVFFYTTFIAKNGAVVVAAAALDSRIWIQFYYDLYLQFEELVQGFAKQRSKEINIVCLCWPCIERKWEKKRKNERRNVI